MKIGLITGEYPPMEGGVGAFTQELAKALHEAGHEIHVITSRDARPANYPRVITRVPEPMDLDYAWLHPHIKSWNWSSLAKIVDIILRHELDIINIQYQAAAFNMKNPAINFLPWRLKALTTCVVTYHDLRVPYLFPKAGKLRGKAVTIMADKAAGVIVTNSSDFSEAASSVETNIVQIPIGSNIKTYSPNPHEIDDVQEELGLSNKDILLGYFGFLNESKGADTLIQSLSSLDERFSLLFIGGKTGASDPTNAAFLDNIKAQVDSLGLSDRVHWTGFVSDVRVSTFLNSADLMVMPYRDGVSLRRGTLMAVLAHGRPLITTTPPEEIPDLIHGGNIWFVPPDDSESLVKAIDILTADKALRENIGRNAAETAGTFAWEKIAAKTISFFESLGKER